MCVPLWGTRWFENGIARSALCGWVTGGGRRVRDVLTIVEKSQENFG